MSEQGPERGPERGPGQGLGPRLGQGPERGLGQGPGQGPGQSSGQRRAPACLPALCALCLAAPGLSPAASYPLDGPLIGGLTREIAARRDTLSDIARRHGLGLEEIKLANPQVPAWLPRPGAEITLPTYFVLPDVEREGLVLNIPEMRLYYFPADQKDVVITHPLGVGREGWNTPYMETHISEKKVRPHWHPPESIRREHVETTGEVLPRVVKPGPDNPLGEYAMRLGRPEYLIHGTNQPWGVGMRVSHGCIRLYPEDIASLFPRVARRTKVRIINQAYKIAEQDGLIYLEMHPFLKEDRMGFHDIVQALLRRIGERSGARAYWLDRAAIAQALGAPRGYPRQIGFYYPGGPGGPGGGQGGPGGAGEPARGLDTGPGNGCGGCEN